MKKYTFKQLLLVEAISLLVAIACFVALMLFFHGLFIVLFIVSMLVFGTCIYLWVETDERDYARNEEVH